jgi:hypothetical protein
MLASFYRDIPILSSLDIIVNAIIIITIEYYFAISLIKTTFVLKNEYNYYLFEITSGE